MQTALQAGLGKGWLAMLRECSSTAEQSQLLLIVPVGFASWQMACLMHSALLLLLLLAQFSSASAGLLLAHAAAVAGSRLDKRCSLVLIASLATEAIYLTVLLLLLPLLPLPAGVWTSLAGVLPTKQSLAVQQASSLASPALKTSHRLATAAHHALRALPLSPCRLGLAAPSATMRHSLGTGGC
jgi:hypothetical protein